MGNIYCKVLLSYDEGWIYIDISSNIKCHLDNLQSFFSIHSTILEIFSFIYAAFSLEPHTKTNSHSVSGVLYDVYECVYMYIRGNCADSKYCGNKRQ